MSLLNIEKNITFDLQLLDNEHRDIHATRSDYENWIPFNMSLKTNCNEYYFNEEVVATFTVYEIKNFLNTLEGISEQKKIGNEIKKYEFSCSEGFFDFIVYDPLEENELYIEIWINLALMSQGMAVGYDEGIRFVVTVDALDDFINKLKTRLSEILL